MSACIYLHLKPCGTGYVYVRVDGRQVGAHKVSWERANGRIVPPGLVVDHTCHNADPSCPGGVACSHRACVNPDHLEVVTQRENTNRSPFSVAGINSRKTHCHRGHEFTPENTRVEAGNRRCRTCARDWAAADRLRRRSAS